MIAPLLLPPVRPLPKIECRPVADDKTRCAFAEITSVCFEIPPGIATCCLLPGTSLARRLQRIHRIRRGTSRRHCRDRRSRRRVGHLFAGDHSRATASRIRRSPAPHRCQRKPRALHSSIHRRPATPSIAAWASATSPNSRSTSRAREQSLTPCVAEAAGDNSGHLSAKNSQCPAKCGAGYLAGSRSPERLCLVETREPARNAGCRLNSPPHMLFSARYVSATIVPKQV